jgi:PAS domain S-box-containing protein
MTHDVASRNALLLRIETLLAAPDHSRPPSEATALLDSLYSLYKETPQADPAPSDPADPYAHAPVGFLRLDSRGVVLDVNPVACDFVRRQRKDVLHAPFSALVHPDYRDVFELHLRSVVQSDRRQTCDLVLAQGDGTFLDTRIDSIGEGPDGARVVRSVLTDIAMRKRSEQELKEGQDLLRAVIEGTPDAVYVKDARGRYIFANGEAARMMGRDAAEVIGKDDSLITGGRERRPGDVDRSVMTARSLRTVEETMGAPGEEKILLTTKGPLFDADGAVSGLFSISRDVTSLKRAQKALVDSETQLRQTLKETESLNRDLRHKAEELDTILNTVPIGIAVSYDPQCLHIKGNAAYASMLGLDVKDNLSRTAPPGQRPHNFREMRDGQLFAPRDLPMQKAAARGVRVDNVEMDLVHDDGRVVNILSNAAPLLNEHGRPRGSVGVFVDVSELKKVQEGLSKAHRKIARILESVTDGFVSFDREWHYTYVNDTACRLLRRTREELLGQPALATFSEGLGLKSRAEFLRAMAGHKPVHFEEFFSPLDAWYECRCYPSSDGLSVYFQDITERKKSEEARALHVAKLDTLIDISRDVLAAASKDEMMHRVTDGAMALTAEAFAAGGYRGDYLGRVLPRPEPDPVWPQGELFTREGQEAQSAGWAASGGNDRAPGNEKSPGKKGVGSTAEIAAATDHPAWSFGRSPISSPSDGPSAVPVRSDRSLTREDEAMLSQLAAIATLGLRHIEARNEVEELVEQRTEELKKAYQALQAELRERKRTEQQLRHAHKMDALGTMASGIGHDFNNILAAIIGFTQLVCDRLVRGSKEKERLQKVLDAGMKGREIVKQMLLFARQGEDEKTALPVRNIVEETVRLVKASVPATISVALDVRGAPGFVLGNPVQLRQVVVNLCNNAAHAMRESGGRLDIGLDDYVVPPRDEEASGMKPGAYMRLCVRDTGVGIAPEDIERIFDPFFTTEKKGRPGLGLSVVHGIVRQAGGYVRAASKPGEGSEFSVYLPKILESREAGGVEGEATPAGSERILFVDDEEDLVHIGRKMLKRLGYKVTATTSSAEALETFLASPGAFDVLVTDQSMPEMTGTELAAKVTAERPDMPVVLVTGYSHVMDSESIRAAGIRAFAMKPLTKGEMARTIRKVLDGKE